MPRYTCTHCEATMNSKNPHTRNIFMGDMALNAFSAMSCADLEPDRSYPERMDIVIRLTRDRNEDDHRKDAASFLDAVTELTPKQRKQVACGWFGHDWYSPQEPEV